MSVVVAIKHNEVIYLGADSQVTRGGTRKSLHNPNNFKIFKVLNSDNVLMAGVGTISEMCILRTSKNLLGSWFRSDYNLNYNFIVNELTKNMYKLLDERKLLKNNDGIPYMENNYLICQNDKLFFINGDSAILEIDDYIAIGSGANESIGSLLSTMGKEPEERILMAIKASVTNDIYVDYPIIMINTSDLTFKILSDSNEYSVTNN